MPATRSCSTRRRRSCASATVRARAGARRRSSRRSSARRPGRPRSSRPRASRASTPRGPSSSCRPRSWPRPAAAPRARQTAPLALEFGLQISRFGWDRRTARRRWPRSRARPRRPASRLWVMDHVVQIPQVGREWEDMLESHTTLGYLAGVTARIRLGTLVTGITHRNIPHLAKLVATLDVAVRRPRAMRDRRGLARARAPLYGWEFPPLAERFARLEDALELLPLMWGTGSPPYEGRTISVPEATCYPRPLQERIPVLVGGSGERRTLRLVARHADACNLFGDRRPCATRSACCARSAPPKAGTRRRSPSPISAGPGWSAAGEPREGRGAATVEEHVGRYRELAEAGVQTAIVGLSDAAARSGHALRRGGRRLQLDAAPPSPTARPARDGSRHVARSPSGSGATSRRARAPRRPRTAPADLQDVRPDMEGPAPRSQLYLHGWGATSGRASTSVARPPRRAVERRRDPPAATGLVWRPALAGARRGLEPFCSRRGAIDERAEIARGRGPATGAHGAAARSDRAHARPPVPVAMISGNPGGALRRSGSISRRSLNTDGFASSSPAACSTGPRTGSTRCTS